MSRIPGIIVINMLNSIVTRISTGIFRNISSVMPDMSMPSMPAMPSIPAMLAIVVGEGVGWGDDGKGEQQGKAGEVAER